MIDHQKDKIEWLNTLWATTLSFLENEKKEFPASHKIDPQTELMSLKDQLLIGFQALTNELRKLSVEAAVELYQWEMENGEKLDHLFQLNPEKLVEEQDEFYRFVQEAVPFKFAEYLFYAAQSLYIEHDYHRATFAFQLLTLLYPQNGDFQNWLGLSQRARRLPEFSLIPLTIAALVSPENPYPSFYLAESWMLLKGWEQMKQALQNCLKTVGTNPFLIPLKAKCEELLNMLPALSSDKIVLPPLAPIPIQMAPRDAIHKVLSSGTATQQKEFSEESWSAFQDKLEEKLGDLTAQLKDGDSYFNRSVNAFGYFERRDIHPIDKSVVLPKSNLFAAEILAAGFFLGTLAAGIKISAANKMITEVPTNIPMNVAYTFSSFLDQNDIHITEGITKYIYICDTKNEMAINQVMINPSYGSTSRPYEEDREKGEVRVSHFLLKDIQGKSILDFGCNEGFVLFACQKLGASSITGIDLASRCIESAKKRVEEKEIPNANFYVGDMENSAFLSTLPTVDTVFLLAILDTSNFVNKTAIIARTSHFAKQTLYYEGHLFTTSHVPRMYDFLISTSFTRFEYLGTYERRPLMRFSRELIEEKDIPPNAITSDATDAELLNASEIYLFTDSPRNPPFSKKCKLIQFVTRKK